jgi:hypothetical protein
MGADLPRIVDSVRSDLMREYRKDPSAVWNRPFVVIVGKGGETGYVDGQHPDEKIMGWLASWKRRRIEAVVVGRMVVKTGKTIDPTTQQPIIIEKAILVSGRSFQNGRSILSITPTKEHRDYRGIREIEAGHDLLRPGMGSPDVTKKMTTEEGEFVGYMQGAFGKEQRFDSRRGQQCVLDPLIQGAVGARAPAEGA